MSSRPIIAVLDDEPMVCRALVRLLRSAHFEVKAFTESEEFFDSLHTSVPDCLLVDHTMPGVTGRDVLQRLTHDGAVMPVIVMTASQQAGLPDRYLAAGAVACLRKPITRAQLLHTIENAMARRALHART
jgi:FixJ family two-component response regulator